MRFDRAVTALTLCLWLVSLGCGSQGKTGSRGSSCTMKQASDGAVLIACDDGTSATLNPPQPTGADAGPAQVCRFERSELGVTITCPDGSSAVIPTSPPPVGDAGSGLDAATPTNCQVDEAADGRLTITCPDGSSAVIPAEPVQPASSLRIVGASAASCGGCHDGPSAKAHFKVMSRESDGGVRESCGTCHAESGIRPVSSVHAHAEREAPGLSVVIESASVNAATRVITAQLKLSDTQGNPISRQGISFELLVARVGTVTSVDGTAALAGPYENYLTRSVAQQDHPDYPLGGNEPRNVLQPTTEAGTGTFIELAPGSNEGRYLYTFQYVLPEGYAATSTHLVALHAQRSLNGVRFVADASHFFVPNPVGAPVAKRAAVSSETCKSCHSAFSAHGGAIEDVQVCLGCHSQGAVDPESNHTLDFNVMIHRIHRGRKLPSVQAGTAYGFVAEEGKSVDFSRVGYPQPIENCQSCHTSSDDSRWVINGRRDVCTSCHERIDQPWAQGGHPFALSPDATCSNGNCHGVGGRVRDVREAHLTFLNDPRARVFKLEIVSATVADADARLQMRIRARVGKRSTPDASYTPITNAAQLASLDVFINGPNWGYLKDGNTLRRYAKNALLALNADPEHPGELTFELPESLRLSVMGIGDPERDSYTVSLGAVYDPTPGAAPDDDRTSALAQPTRSFSAAESLVPRRSVVRTERCNGCHGDLRHHQGELYASTTEQCAMCHTASLDTRVRQSADGIKGVTQSLRLGSMIHRIHGEKIATQPYLVYGDGPSDATLPYPRVDYSARPFSGDARECNKCHANGTYLLPLPDAEPPTTTRIIGSDAQTDLH